MHRLPTAVTTERLLLRHWEDGDVAALHDAIQASAEHLRPWMVWIAEEPLSFERRLEFIAHTRTQWANRGDSVYGVFLDGAVIGGCGLHRRGDDEGELHIGYWLHVDHTGRGYATELAGALTDTAFEDPDIVAVVIEHDAANARSAAVPERLRFTPEHAADADGHWVMRRAEWSHAADRT